MIDTHCHIHSKFYTLDPDEVIAQSKQAGVRDFICVGVDADDSEEAINFASKRDNVYASVGIHPHEATDVKERLEHLKTLVNKPKVVAVGEIGLDYWYENAPKKDQEPLLRAQIELALENDLPIIFHVRGSKEDSHAAFVDFFRIIDSYTGIRGVVHSFTAGQKSLAGVLSRSLLIGVNGIATFTKDEDMLAAYEQLPLESMVLETDAPFLTPSPKRGIVNTPQYMGYTAEFLAKLREEKIAELIAATSMNAEQLFGINEQ